MTWTIRQFLDAFNRCTSCGWLEWDEALCLADWAMRTKGPMLEVGSYQGRSATLLAQLPDGEGSLRLRELHCVDPWANGFHSELSGDAVLKRFVSNVGSVPGQRVVWWRKRVEEWMPLHRYEFVYLDGDHTYKGTLAQLQVAKIAGAKIIAVHDVNDDGEGAETKRACLELLGPWRERVRKLAVWENLS